MKSLPSSGWGSGEGGPGGKPIEGGAFLGSAHSWWTFQMATAFMLCPSSAASSCSQTFWPLQFKDSKCLSSEEPEPEEDASVDPAPGGGLVSLRFGSPWSFLSRKVYNLRFLLLGQHIGRAPYRRQGLFGSQFEGTVRHDGENRLRERWLRSVQSGSRKG